MAPYEVCCPAGSMKNGSLHSQSPRFSLYLISQIQGADVVLAEISFTERLAEESATAGMRQTMHKKNNNKNKKTREAPSYMQHQKWTLVSL